MTTTENPYYIGEFPVPVKGVLDLQDIIEHLDEIKDGDKLQDLTKEQLESVPDCQKYGGEIYSSFQFPEPTRIACWNSEFDWNDASLLSEEDIEDIGNEDLEFDMDKLTDYEGGGVYVNDGCVCFLAGNAAAWKEEKPLNGSAGIRINSGCECELYFLHDYLIMYRSCDCFMNEGSFHE